MSDQLSLWQSLRLRLPIPMSRADGLPRILVVDEDTMMPGVGGLEVCERLRSGLKTAFVPVLTLTGATTKPHGRRDS